MNNHNCKNCKNTNDLEHKVRKICQEYTDQMRDLFPINSKPLSVEEVIKLIAINAKIMNDITEFNKGLANFLLEVTYRHEQE